MKTGTLHALALSALLSAPALADQARIDRYKAQLSTARPAELANDTARIVSNSGDAVDAVTAAITLNGPSAGLVVGSVAKASPQSAGAAAATALGLQPKLTATIVTAAVKAAPGEVSAIVSESCKARPSSFYTIGVAAAQAAPRSGDQVLPAITSAVPALKPFIERAQSDFKKQNRTASLALLLKHTENLVAALSGKENVGADMLLAGNTDSSIAVKLASLADAPPPPVQQPPFVPGGGTPGEIPGNQTPEVPPTGRNYSTP